MSFTMLIGCALLFALLALEVLLLRDINFSFDRQLGIFGCFYPDDQFWFNALFIGGFCGGLSTYLQSVCLESFSSMILCVVFLFEPGVSQVVACFLGIDQMPGWTTFLGSAAVTTGLVLVTYGNLQTQKIETHSNY